MVWRQPATVAPPAIYPPFWRGESYCNPRWSCCPYGVSQRIHTIFRVLTSPKLPSRMLFRIYPQTWFIEKWFGGIC